MTLMTPARHRVPDDDLIDELALPAADRVRTRIGGVSVLTKNSYLALKDEAEGEGVRARWARRRLAAEDRRRALAIRRAVESGGFDIDGARVAGPMGVAGAGGGRVASVLALPEWRTTTAQVAGGFWPFAIGASSPLLGTPLGMNLRTGQDFGCDPLSWFLGGLITAPIAFVLGLNGFGKSSLVRRMALGSIAQGHTSLFLGDIKPDYGKLTEEVGGQVITGGYGHQKINPLAAGALGAVLEQLPEGEKKATVAADLRARQVETVAGLIGINRRGTVAEFEETLLGSALDVLYAPCEEGGKGFTGANPPVLGDLYEVVKQGNPTLFEDAGVATGDVAEYVRVTADLRRSLRSLVTGRLGKVLNGQTTTPLDLDAPAVCIDVSRVPQGDKKLKAALLLVCWAEGFGAVEAAHVLADAGLGPRRTFQIVIDELWQVIGSGAGIVDRVDALVRLNRVDALSLIMVTHSIADLSAFESQADANKAIGFLEKAQLKFIGPVGPEELERLEVVTPTNPTERAVVTNAASTPPPSDATLQKLRARMRRGEDSSKSSVDRPRPHGQGVFLVKFGADNRPGTAIRMLFTPVEAAGGVHNTNSRFEGVSTRRGDQRASA